MQQLNRAAIHAYVMAQNAPSALRRLVRDERGVTVSAILMIGALVAATALFLAVAIPIITNSTTKVKAVNN